MSKDDEKEKVPLAINTGKPRKNNLGNKYPLDTEADLAVVKAMASVGLPISVIAVKLGVSKPTLERRFRDTPALRDAYMKGRAEALNEVANSAFNMAISEKSEGMTKWWLERQGSAIVNEIESQLHHDEQVGSEDMSQREKLLDALEKDKFIDIKVDGEESD